MFMEQAQEINLLLKYADIDNAPFSQQEEGWVSALVQKLRETLAFYLQQPVHILTKNETALISEEEFKTSDAVIFVFSPAFMLSSNLAATMALIEKAVSFNVSYINSKIHKVLKGPIDIDSLPSTISMGRFHHFYQQNSMGDSGYETLFGGDKTASVQGRYWESFSNLLFDLLKALRYPKWERFIPSSDQTVYLGSGDLEQLWNRNNLYGELHARGIKVLPDHDHSIEVKYLNDPQKFYLEKSTLAIHFPEEFLPLSEKKLADLAAMPSLQRYIWFNPESGKNRDKQKHYEDLKLKLKNLDHVEAITSNIEELKEIVFGRAQQGLVQDSAPAGSAESRLYLIVSERFSEEIKSKILHQLSQLNITPLLLDQPDAHLKRQQHYQYLKHSNFCLICYDGLNPEWLRANINEVKKAAGLNPDKDQTIRLGLFTAQHPLPEMAEAGDTYVILTGGEEHLQESLASFIHEN